LKHDVAILLALVAVLAAAGALALAGVEHRRLRTLEELSARKPYFGWESEHASSATCVIPWNGFAYVGTAW
jgi:hypothetical protein